MQLSPPGQCFLALDQDRALAASKIEGSHLNTRKSKPSRRGSIANTALRRSPNSDRDTSAYRVHDRDHDLANDRDRGLDRDHGVDRDRVLPQRRPQLGTTDQSLLPKSWGAWEPLVPRFRSRF